MDLQLYGTAKQLQYVASRHRYRTLIGGRRSGKSMAFAMDTAASCLTMPKQRELYLGPSNALCKEFFKEITQHPALRPLIRKVLRKEPYYCEFIDGSYVVFRNWKNIDLLRGFKFHKIFVDEVQNFPEQHYHSTVVPLTRDLRGRITLSGQFGKSWYHDIYKKGLCAYELDNAGRIRLYPDGHPQCGEKIPNTQHASWLIPTNEALMFQGASGAQEWQRILESTPPAVLDCEYLCVPTARADAVFPYSELELITVKDTGFLNGPRDKQSYIMSLDIGRSVDPTVALVMEAETGQIVYAEKFPLRMPYPAQAHKAGLLHKQWRNCTTMIDSTGLQGVAGGRDKHDPIVPLFRTQISDLREFKWNYSNKLHLITHLGIEIRNRTIAIPDAAREMLRQLNQYTYRYRSSGFLTFSAPQGDHDDYVSCLAVLCWARHLGWYARANAAGWTPKGL